MLSHLLGFDQLLDHGDGLLVIVAGLDGGVVGSLHLDVDEELLIDQIDDALERGDFRAISHVELLQIVKGLLEYVLDHPEALVMDLPVVAAMDHHQHIISCQPYL